MTQSDISNIGHVRGWSVRSLSPLGWCWCAWYGPSTRAGYALTRKYGARQAVKALEALNREADRR